MSSNGITVDQLLAEWQKYDLDLPGEHRGMTTAEIQKALNITYRKALELVKEGIENGVIRNETEMRRNPLRGGRRYPANIFVVVEKKGG
jgi:DNA-binding Lrp family transcriptional regulator